MEFQAYLKSDLPILIKIGKYYSIFYYFI